jgi:tetratricopeptide (TPR) repeat protein
VSHDSVRVFDGRAPEKVRAERESPKYQAQRYVEKLLDLKTLTSAALASLERDTSLAPAVRAEARGLLETCPDDPLRLNLESWAIVKHPLLDSDLYRVALRKARAATLLAPENGLYLNTRGIAEYRLGRYDEALDTLSRSEQINVRVFSGGHPADIAFIAMCMHHLGMAEGARNNLIRLQELMKQDPWNRNNECQLFVRDAELLISGTFGAATDESGTRSTSQPSSRLTPTVDSSEQ